MKHDENEGARFYLRDSVVANVVYRGKLGNLAIFEVYQPSKPKKRVNVGRQFLNLTENIEAVRSNGKRITYKIPDTLTVERWKYDLEGNALERLTRG